MSAKSDIEGTTNKENQPEASAVTETTTEPV
jgi:hypothetical protein